MSGMNAGHVEELLPAHALGSLSPEEKAEVRRHLRSCASCRAALEEYQEVVGALGLVIAPVQPPPGLKERLLRGLGPQRRAPAELLRPAPRSWPVWAAAALAAVLVLAVFNVLLWQRVRRLESFAAPLSSRVISLSPTEAAQAAWGVLVYSRTEPSGTLVVEDLPPLASGRQYQLWLIRDGRRTSGGVFSVSASGYGALQVSAPLPLGDYQAFGITVEPAGGSPGPTGRKVLGAEG